VTPELQGQACAKAQSCPEGFQKLPLLSLMIGLVVPQKKIPAHGLFDLLLHATEVLHGGPVFRACWRRHIRGAEEVEIIKKLIHAKNSCHKVYFL